MATAEVIASDGHSPGKASAYRDALAGRFLNFLHLD